MIQKLRGFVLVAILLVLTSVALQAQQQGQNPLLDVRLSRESCSVTGKTAVLQVWIESQMHSGAKRKIQQMQNSLLLDSYLATRVKSVTMGDFLFPTDNYRLVHHYDQNQGIIEFLYTHLPQKPYFELGTGVENWQKLFKISIEFELDEQAPEQGSLTWYNDTPYFSVRAIQEGSNRSETIHNEKINSVLTVKLTPTSVKLSDFQAQSTDGSVEIAWLTNRDESTQGFYLYKSYSRDGEYVPVAKNLIPVQKSEMPNYRFRDMEATVGQTIYYKLADMDVNGVLTYHGPISVEVCAPNEYALESNFPNPFNPETRITFKVKERGQARLSVSNVLGQEVRILVNQVVEAGTHEAVWDGRDDNGQILPTGTYFYTFKVNNYSASRSMQFMK